MGKQVFIQGHPEYDRMTLDGEYHRDLGKGLKPEIPCNYYENDDPDTVPVLKLEEWGQYAVWELAELLCISDHALFAGGGRWGDL